MRILKWVGLNAFTVLFIFAVYLIGIWYGLFGESLGPGDVTTAVIPPELIESRTKQQLQVADRLQVQEPKQILFGDLHVHTTFSSDAFLWSLPLMQGEGVHPPADACDFARFCSALDFWSINDHAESLTPKRWLETKESIRQCNAVSTGSSDPKQPDVVAFLGWEWTQVANVAANHYGHKNVIFRDQEDELVPLRPIAAGGANFASFRRGGIGGTVLGLVVPLLDFPNRQRYFDFDRYGRETAAIPLCNPALDVRELPADCVEWADTPSILFEKLDQWGFESIVIPHGTTWGNTTPRNASWVAQLVAGAHDANRQKMIEVYSGHGNSEEYRDWRAMTVNSEGAASCPEATTDYTPNCWQAGEIIRARCIGQGIEWQECDVRAALARQHHVDAGKAGFNVITAPQGAGWLDSGQCRDCFLPAFDYRPGLSVQAALAVRDFSNPDQPRGFRFGLMASSDNHKARPGTGYKEFGRIGMIDQFGITKKWIGDLTAGVEPTAESLPPEQVQPGYDERMDSFWQTGGLIAVHAAGRDRDSIWDGLSRKEVYGTSGPRILLWFDLLGYDLPGEQGVPMGGEVRRVKDPSFRVRAVGSLKQAQGCPHYSTGALSADRIESLCKGECYNPTDERQPISRIEVVRIRPQMRAGEPIAPLIEDPWRSFDCPNDANGCVVEFSDTEFALAQRETVYYVRALQEPTPAVNGDDLRCDYDESGRCVKIDVCYGGYRTEMADDCLGEVQERAWSSPIFVDYGTE